MTYYSRGIVRHGNGTKRPQPLKEFQKNIIESWARRGRRDREIADHLGIDEYRVNSYRHLLGIRGAVGKGQHQASYEAKALRPSHVRGEVGSDEWYRSCEFAFQSAVIAAGRW